MFKKVSKNNLVNLANKGFTLIELIVVVGIIGILVGIAQPRFSGFIEKAETARIQNDIVVLEGEVNRSEILEKDDISTWTIGTVGHDILKSASNNEALYDRKGKVLEDSSIDKSKSYHIVPELVTNKINTLLEGQFYYDGDKKIYYSKEEAEGVSPYTDKEIDDFIEKETDVIPVANYEDLMAIGSGGEHLFAEGTKWETKRTTNISDERFYMQVNDIDLAGKDYSPIGSSGWAFKGSYNGGNFTISNLSVNRPNSPFSGMFGKVFGSTIMDLNLKNVDIAGDYSTGGLVGYIEGSGGLSTIKNVHLTGSVKSSDNTGGLIGYSESSNISDSTVNVNVIGSHYGGAKFNIGGLIGGASSDPNSINNVHVKAIIKAKDEQRNVGGIAGAYSGNVMNSISDVTINGGEYKIGGVVGDLKRGGKITNSYSNATLTTNGKSVGGIAGEVSDGSHISRSSSNATINAADSNVGGIAGENFGTIDNSYSLGLLKGSHDVGGVVGDNRGLIKNSYSKAKVSIANPSRDTVGGVVGKRSPAGKDTVSSYFNESLSGVNKGTGNHSDIGAKALTAEEMKSKSSYSGWDFDSIWILEEGMQSPELR